MSDYIGVFERKEVKYVLSASQYQRFRVLMDSYMRVDDYGETRINSLYFDTPQRELIERSLDKPLYKEKLRMRWYERLAQDELDRLPAESADTVFIELKKKFKGIVYKRRLSCARKAAQAYLAKTHTYEEAVRAFPLDVYTLEDTELTARSVQIAREIDAFCTRWENLCPSMLISCNRIALTLKEQFASEENVRITFDSRLVYQDLALSGGEALSSTQRPILDPTCVVMEIKVAGPYPLWLVEALDECDIRPQSFSKYGEAYKQSGKVRLLSENVLVREEERCA
ncbi:polyphosphate polymerase domain-containing protein [Eggerthellaceae bacterium 3-80]|nr:polyphosphate polymerase domain-containing protein [bacterium D16-34]